ncbi:MAG: HlyD family efflux transporter periplasmic adaptor subunit [Paracoccaceae bacterium]
MGLKPRSIALIGLLGALMLGLLYLGFRPDPVPVDLQPVDRGAMRVTVDADGQTQIRDIYEVSAPIFGTALRAPVAVGDRVTTETVVAVVEPVAPSLLDSRSRLQAEAAVREAEAALHVAETDLIKAFEDQAFAKSQHDRVKALVERAVSSLTQLEDAAQRLVIAQAATEAAQARIDMAQGTLERARAALVDPTGGTQGGDSCCVRLRAPADGVVLSIPTISERPVAAGELLVTVGDPGNLELVADLLSSDAVRLAPGAEALVERWGGPGVLRARLLRVEPKARTKISALGIEEQRVDAIFELVSPPAARPGLGDGFSVFLRIIEWEVEDAVQVPLSAVFRRGDQWAVFVSRAGVVEERSVTLGQRNRQSAEVLDGLEPGEMIITHPGDDVVEGAKVVDRGRL